MALLAGAGRFGAALLRPSNRTGFTNMTKQNRDIHHKNFGVFIPPTITELSPNRWAVLQKHCDLRSMTMKQLCTRILNVVAKDDLVNAILDDGVEEK